MAKNIKLTRKKMKQPDEFITWTDRLLSWTEEHVWQVLGLLGVIMVLALAVRMGSSWIKSSKDTKRVDLARAINVYNTPVQDNTFAPSFSAAGSKYNTPEQKYQATIESFKKVVESNPETTEGELSLIYIASSYENLRDYNSAIDYYNKFANSKLAKKEPVFKDAASLGVARCEFAKGENAKVLQALDQLIEQGSAVKNDAMLLKARALFVMGEQEKGREMLKKLKQESPDDWTSQSADFLALYWEKQQAGEGGSSLNIDVDLDELGESSVEMPEGSEIMPDGNYESIYEESQPAPAPEPEIGQTP